MRTALIFAVTLTALTGCAGKLDKVTAEDVKRLAIAQLADLRVGVIFGRKDFKDSWATDLIKKTMSSAKGPS